MPPTSTTCRWTRVNFTKWTHALSDDELDNLVTTLTKIGDTNGAARYRTILQKRRHTQKGLPVQQQISRAFHQLRAAEGKLSRAVEQFMAVAAVEMRSDEVKTQPS